MRLVVTIIVFFCWGSVQAADIKGDVVIFHAGSLSIPFRQISKDFEKEYPGTRVLLESAGSRSCARKISDLKRECDVMASSDCTVIDTLLMPEHADWNIKFARNELSLVYDESSRRSKDIDENNWHEILMDKDVAFGRADPNSDPCGYRTVLALQLAEKHYQVTGLAEKALAKDTRYIRPKEVDLLALLETGEIDYIFLYRSVAEQHGLRYVRLPDEVNMGDPTMEELYSSVSVGLSGKEPGTTITRRGASMVYGVTIPKNSPNPETAIAFVSFLLDKEKGLKTMEKNGQTSVVPAISGSFDKIPAELRNRALPPKK